MGRPLNKKYFGNRNIGSASTATDDNIGGKSVASVTIAGVWSGFTQATSTVTFGAPTLPGGVTATGTVTITSGAPTSVTITEKGSGYTTAPTVTIADSDVGAETSGTATAVLSADSGNVSSVTNQENAIVAYGYVGGVRQIVDIIRQVNGKSYKIKGANGTVQSAKLVTDANASADGEVDIQAEDSGGGTYRVAKLSGRKATVIRSGSGPWEFASGASVPWTFTAAPAATALQTDYNVKINNV